MDGDKTEGAVESKSVSIQASNGKLDFSCRYGTAPPRFQTASVNINRVLYPYTVEGAAAAAAATIGCRGLCCDLRIKFTGRLRLLIMRVRYGVTKGYASMLSGVTDDSEFPMESIALATSNPYCDSVL